MVNDVPLLHQLKKKKVIKAGTLMSHGFIKRVTE